MTTTTDTLIIGGGVAGTASAFALCQKGKDVILCEQSSTLAPATASSNGDSRMYRKMYSNEFFSRMQAKALDRWADVERSSGESLLQQNGLLFYGEDTGETVEGSVLGAKQVMENLNLPHKFYATGDDIAAAYPALSEGCKGKPYSGVYEETAGHIRASKACHAMIKAAKDNDSNSNCEVRLNTKIVSLDTTTSPSEVVAITESGEKIVAKNVVLCAGPWTNSVLKSSNLPPLQLDIWQVQWGHYEIINDTKNNEIPQAFHFRKETGIDGGLYYVFPASATECLQQPSSENNNKKKTTYVKVGVDFPTGESLQDMRDFDFKGSEEVQKLMDEWVVEHINGESKRIDSFCHPYTMTSDSYFIMDKLKSNVVIFAGGSGRAFKFGPLLGDCIASLLLNEEAPVDLTPFKATRDAT
eukprot:CAMPEP_0194173504 /NCGR_PEP_ID=MMETSP0154-20130528/7822_1 /TAXON_ID=1049557 /ORGANISM="Thalassiothrix antarctica, Strain L6-D1" /LENGTH=412 /DNA_ID=CAMNT_0038886589 /DNA_START=235 /DNA_END=1469 /DNA_ORIENTATION=+